MSFESVWQRIEGNAGETFRMKRGEPLTYAVSGNYIMPNRTAYSIGRRDFEKAHSLWPLDGPGSISNEVRGSAYIWAILADPRILGPR